MVYCKELSRGRLKGGYDPEFRKRYKFQVPNQRSVTITPAIAAKETEYVDAGYKVQINGGAQRPAYLDRLNHAVLFHPDYIQNWTGGSRPLTTYSRDDCRGLVQALWDSRNGYGVITSGAQEARYDGDPWAQLHTVAPNQYIWIEEKWAELAAANPGTINAGCYDGVIIIDPGQFSESVIRQACSSPAAAHAFMLQYESEYYPYFRKEMWRYKPICLINQYQRGSTNSHTRNAQCRLTILIVQLARIHCGLNPEDMMIFCFLNKAEFTKYTTRYVRNLAGGGKLISYDFTQYSRNFMLALALNIRKVKHSFFWEDTSYGREGTDVVPATYVREDGFTIITTEGSNAPKAAPQVSPWNVNTTYPCLHSPKGGEDMAGLAGLWYQKMWAHVQQKPQNAAYRVPGGEFCTVDSGYDYDRWKANDCWVEVAEDDTNYVIVIEDFVHNKVAKRTIDVKLPSGAIISGLTYKTGGVRVYRGQK
jgi:hypothetical protein